METSVDNDLSLQTEQCSLRMYYKQTERKKATFKWKNADDRKSENHNGLGWLAGCAEVVRTIRYRPSWRASVTRSPAAYDKRIVLRTHFVHTYPRTPGTNIPLHTPYFCRSNYSWQYRTLLSHQATSSLVPVMVVLVTSLRARAHTHTQSGRI